MQLYQNIAPSLCTIYSLIIPLQILAFEQRYILKVVNAINRIQDSHREMKQIKLEDIGIN